MGLIKSALELALERTSDIQADKQALDERKFNEEGMKLFSRLEKDEVNQVSEYLNELSKTRVASVKRGLLKVMLGRISLPSSEQALEQLPVIAKAIELLFPNQKALAGLTEQLKQFYQGYLEDRTRVIDNLKERFEPQLRQKEEQLAMQTGQRMRLHPESDPEFAKAVKANIDQLDAQYSQVIEQARNELEQKYQEG